MAAKSTVQMAISPYITLPFRRSPIDTGRMETLFVGIGFGVLTVAMPGPVSVSLVQVASLQGRASGVRAAVGVASGDVVVGLVALGMVSLGGRMPPALFAMAQLVTAIALLGFGLALMSRPLVVQERASTVSRPLRTFLLLTSLMPTALGSWLALLISMPFAGDRSELAAFALGIVSVSAVWHPLLGVGAGSIGPRLTPGVLRVGTQIGGLATLLLGVWALIVG